jgi:hypothetical protein
MTEHDMTVDRTSEIYTVEIPRDWVVQHLISNNFDLSPETLSKQITQPLHMVKDLAWGLWEVDITDDDSKRILEDFINVGNVSEGFIKEASEYSEKKMSR